MEKLIKNWAEMKSVIEALEPDMVKFTEKNQKAAGTRIRTTMQTIKKIASEIRENVAEAKDPEGYAKKQAEKAAKK